MNASGSASKSPASRGRSRVGAISKLRYGLRWLPNFAGQRTVRHLPKGRVHVIIAMADHFEPSIVPGNGLARAPYDEQERRLEAWCRDDPKAVERWRDASGHPFTRSYFYPAEQYEHGLIARLAEHCRQGWGEVEVHLHHGIPNPDTAQNTRRVLAEFRDRLQAHGCLSRWEGRGPARYGFVHGNFALANSANGRKCGVDSEIQVLAETGCYADFTLPTAAFNAAQISKINSLYECALPLDRRAAHQSGRDLVAGRVPGVFPLMIQGPLVLSFGRGILRPGIENGALTRKAPFTLDRLRRWKRAAIRVNGRPDWLFIKLHGHGMDPGQRDAALGPPMQNFLRELVEGAPGRNENIVFATTREMVNIILAACEGKSGNPAEYRDFRLKPPGYALEPELSEKDRPCAESRAS